MCVISSQPDHTLHEVELLLEVVEVLQSTSVPLVQLGHQLSLTAGSELELISRAQQFKMPVWTIINYAMRPPHTPACRADIWTLKTSHSASSKMLLWFNSHYWKWQWIAKRMSIVTPCLSCHSHLRCYLSFLICHELSTVWLNHHCNGDSPSLSLLLSMLRRSSNR